MFVASNRVIRLDEDIFTFNPINLIIYSTQLMELHLIRFLIIFIFFIYGLFPILCQLLLFLLYEVCDFCKVVFFELSEFNSRARVENWSFYLKSIRMNLFLLFCFIYFSFVVLFRMVDKVLLVLLNTFHFF